MVLVSHLSSFRYPAPYMMYHFQGMATNKKEEKASANTTGLPNSIGTTKRRELIGIKKKKKKKKEAPAMRKLRIERWFLGTEYIFTTAETCAEHK